MKIVQNTDEYISRAMLIELLGKELGSNLFNYICRRLNHSKNILVKQYTVDGKHRVQWVKGHRPSSIIKLLEKHEFTETKPLTWINEFPFIVKSLKEWETK